MSNKLEQLEFKLEKIIGIQKHAGKVRKKEEMIIIKNRELQERNVERRHLLDMKNHNSQLSDGQFCVQKSTPLNYFWTDCGAHLTCNNERDSETQFFFQEPSKVIYTKYSKH